MILKSLSTGCLAVALALPAGASPSVPQGSYTIAMSDSVTAKAVKVLTSGNGTCRQLPSAYQIDCYRQFYRRAAAELSRYPDYKDGRKALKMVESTLNAALKQYRDRSAAPLRSGGQTFKAIKPEGLSPAAEAFRRARADAVTILLRSQGPIKVHYERIAAVVDSAKVIIRSGLMTLRRFI
ncbi:MULTISPECIES: hypothetical protein [unclassified Leisingera]|uniref:hypothetical protein n=1 Tax=unclassified Leisingera TaxID=2614906 RepID=UPI0002EB38D0|nr:MULTISPECIES: hypothetical protein [unclassified Leisingera]KIC22318.1 hypothetical protein RA23_19515 [Leisingera sp. ANG-S3]KIC53497.1 hypothetical protein RA22_09510 [Leisingera sp. ANG-S]KID07892.1 hypothetical protein GC1_17955 [Leisingera sp. ANG1]